MPAKKGEKQKPSLKTDTPSPEENKFFQQGKFLYPLNHFQALAVIKWLKNRPPAEALFQITDTEEPLTAIEAEQALLAYLKSPAFEELAPFLPAAKKTIGQLNEETLSLLEFSLQDLISQKKEEELLKAQDSLLQTKIQEWQEKLAQYEAWQKAVSKESKLEVFSRLEELDLEKQLELIRKFQELAKQQAAEEIQKRKGEPLTPEEEEACKNLGENLSAEVIRQKIVFKADEEAEKESQKIDSLWQAIDNFCETDPVLGKSLPSSARLDLGQKIALQCKNQLKEKEDLNLNQCQNNINEAANLLSSGKNILVENIVHSSQNIFTSHQAESLIKRWHFILDEADLLTVRDIEDKLALSLSLDETLALAEKNIDILSFSQKIAPAAQLYFQGKTYAQKTWPWQKFSSQALSLASRFGFEQDPYIVELLIQGKSREQILKILQKWQKKGFSEERAKNLSQRIKSLKLSRSNRFLLFRLRLKRNFQKFKNFLRGLDPFSYYFFPRAIVRNAWNALIKKVKNPQTKKLLYSFPKILNPFYLAGAPFRFIRQKIGYAIARAGAKIVQKTVVKAGAKAGWQVAKRVFGAVLTKAGLTLAKIGIKEGLNVLGKGVIKAIAALLGIGTGGLGTALAVISFIFDFAKAVFKIVTSPEFIQLIKKTGETIAKTGIGLLLLLVRFISQFPLSLPFALIGASIGGFIGGPAGATVGFLFGGWLGYQIHHSLIPFLQQLTGAIGYGGALPVSSLAAASSTAVVSSVANFFTSASGAVVLTLGTVSTLALVNNMSKSSSFVPAKGEKLAEVESLNQSIYFSVSKTASPFQYSKDELQRIWQENNQAQINYTLKITAHDKDIVITSFEENFSAFPDNPNLPHSNLVINLPYKIPAHQTANFTYQHSFSQNFLNTAVYNTISVRADIINGPSNEISSNTAMVIFGDAPTLCFEKNGPWTDQEWQWMQQSMTYLSQYSHFQELLCTDGPITLTRVKGGTLGGWAKSINEIIIYDRGVQHYNNALYTLAHECGHLIDYRNDQIRQRNFHNSQAYSLEGFLPTYPNQSLAGEFEDFAETIAIYAVWDKLSFRCCGQINFPVQYPLHYNFAHQCIYHNQCHEYN